MRCLILHNPRSGFGSDAIFAFERELIASGDECLFRILSDNFDPDVIVRDASEFDVVVLSGGDGTVSNLMYSLRLTNIPICVFPSGTANLLFANIGNSAEPAALARACRWGDMATCDLAEISWVDELGEEHRKGFSIMAGSGFDAEVMRAAAPNKRAMGEAAYFLAALADPRPQVVQYTIEIDGTTIERKGIACLVANNAMIQGDIEIVPGCVMNDGMLDVIVVETTDTVQLVRPLLAGILDPKGKSARPKIEAFKGKSITVTASCELPMQTDGEVMHSGLTTWHASVLPAVTNLIVDRLSRYTPAESRRSPLFPIMDEIAYPE